MINPLYFDTDFFLTEIGRVIDAHRDSFVRFCAREFSLENYIAYMCIPAFRKAPSLKRIQTFYVAFLKPGQSPMQINVSTKEASMVTSYALAPPTQKRGLFGLGSSIPGNALDSLAKPLETNLFDTYARYKVFALDPSSRYQQTTMGRLFNQYSDGMKALKKTTTTNNEILDGLNILASGGWPVKHMGLTGVVKGF